MAIAQMYMCMGMQAHALLAALSADFEMSTFSQLIRTGGLENRFLTDPALQARSMPCMPCRVRRWQML
jgi:hypothetical protein